MSIEDTMAYLGEGESCVVCGKSLKEGEALMALHEVENKLAICCPLCLAAYQEDSKHYLERLAQKTFLRELVRPRGAESPGGG